LLNKKDSSSTVLIIILIFLLLVVFGLCIKFESYRKSLTTVCTSYSGIVDAINKEVVAGDYTRLDKIADIETEDGKKHYHMLKLQDKIERECRNITGYYRRLPSPEEIRGK